MTQSQAAESDRETCLDDVLAAYWRGVETGQPSDRQALIDRHPEISTELREYFADQDRVEQWTRPLRAISQAATRRDGAAQLQESLVGQSIGDYELLVEIGRGGMGVVYRARQKSLDRLVAVKMILAGRLASERDCQRFRHEAEAAAHLDHPRIVPIYEIAAHEGRPFFSMKLFDGGSLADRIAQYRANPRQAVELIVAIARAVQHAHERGLLHRDLKPSNILMDAQGNPHVADFGLAKWADLDQDRTQTGVIVGTPTYMAPEQTAPSHKPNRNGRDGSTTASDVYGVGAILFTLLTGKPPFYGPTPLDTLLAVREQDPAVPSRLNPLVDRDLNSICLKCLEKDPARRYGSAEALAEDLDRWLAGEPIRARPLSQVARAWRWCRRNPLLAGMTTGIVLLVALGLTALAVGYVLVREQREIAEANSREADRQRKLALNNLRSIIADIDDLENRRPELDDVRQDLLVRVQKYLSAILDDPGHTVQAEETEFWLEIHVGDVFRDNNQIQSARIHYDRSLAITDRMAGDAGAGRTRRRLRSFALSRLGDTHRLQDDFDPAHGYFREMLTLREQLYAAQADRMARADLAVAHLKIGDCFQRRLPTFSSPDLFIRIDEHYARCFELYRSLVEEFPGDIEYARMLGHSWDRLADAHGNRRNWTGAIEACQSALDFRRAARRRFSECELAFDIDNTHSLDRLASFHCETGQFDHAREAAEESLAVRLDLVRRNPRSLAFKRTLGTSHDWLGRSWQALGRHDLAIVHYEQFYELEKELGAENRHDLIPLLDLLIDCSYLDTAYDERTLRYSEERIAIRQSVFASDARNLLDASNLFRNIVELGDYHLLRGRSAEAVRRYQESRRFSEQAGDIAWQPLEQEKLEQRLERCTRAGEPGFDPVVELVGLAGNHELLMCMQQEFYARKDSVRLARVSEQLAQKNKFTTLYAAARDLAQAAALAASREVQQQYDSRCEELIARLLQFGGEANERLRTDPAFNRHASSLTPAGSP